MLKTVNLSRAFSDDLLDRYRQQGDPPADAVIASVVSQHGREGIGSLMGWLGNATELDGLGQPEAVQEFMSSHAFLPDWADRRKMETAMQFFQKNTLAICLVLAYYSLPYCYAGADGARVLWFSERIRKDTRKRLEETVEWLIGVMKKSNWQNGKAIRQTLKVRLLHAAIRWFSRHNGQWDDAWGCPVNQEDMAGTNLAFSYIVIRGLRKAGIAMTEEEEDAYLHQINVTGHLLGVADELLARNRREAFHIDRAIVRRQFRASEQGQELTRSLLETFESFSPSSLRNLPAAQMRFFLDDEVADLLAVPAVPLEKRLVGIATSLPIFPKLISYNLG